jgi:hypothetical protein
MVLLLVHSLQELLQAGCEGADVVSDARVVVTGNHGHLEARKKARPAEIRAIRR